MCNKYKISLFLIVLLVLSVQLTYCQWYGQPVVESRRRMMFSGIFSFTDQSGDLYTSGSGSVTDVTATPSMYYFVNNWLGAGTDLSMSYLSIDGETMTQMRVGPKLGYFIGPADGYMNPYCYLGLAYFTTSFSHEVFSGYSYKFGVGIAPPIGANVNLNIDVGYIIDNLKIYESTFSGGTLYFGIGLANIER